MSAKSTHIKVICRCGAKFRVKCEHAGKRMRCKTCDSVLSISSAGSDNQTTRKNSGSCLNCSSPMESESVLCIECGYHKDEGKQLAAKVGRTRGVDQHVTLLQKSNLLLFTLNWRGTSGILGMNEIVLLVVVWLTSSFVIGPVLSRIAGENQLAGFTSLLGLLLPALYLLSAKMLNQTEVTVTQESIEVRHRPIPWRRSLTIPRDCLSQIFVRRKKWTEGGGGGSLGVEREAYDLCALTTRGARYNLLRMQDWDSALEVEELIENFLGIEDEEVLKFAAPRLQIAIKGVCIIAGGLFLLSLAPAKLNFDRTMETGIFLAAAGLGVSAYGAWRIYFALTEDRQLVEEDLQS